MLSVDADVGCELVAETAGVLVAGAGCGAVGAVDAVGALVAAPVAVLGAVAGVGWAAVVTGAGWAAAVAFDALSDCVACPWTGWVPALCGVFGAAAGAVAPVGVPVSTERSAPPSPLWWTSDPLVVEPPKSGVGAWPPDVPATVVPMAAGWPGAGLDAPVHDVPAAVPDPALCTTG